MERRGKCNRVVGVRTDVHHHGDRLDVPDSVISLFVGCFSATHTRFAYHGYTEYAGGALEELEMCLGKQLAELGSMDEENFSRLLAGSLIEDDAKPAGVRRIAWLDLREMIVDYIVAILDRVRQARQSGRVLLVLGV